jgi:hypothetical protein
VPFRRLLREWLIVAPILAVALWLMQRDTAAFAGSLIGLAASLPLYIGFGYVLAKFGYQRRTLADLRTPRASAQASDTAGSTVRPRPAPTRRTSGGGKAPGRKRR